MSPSKRAALTIILTLATSGTVAAQSRDSHKRPAPAVAHTARGEKAEAGDQEHAIATARVPAVVREAVHHAYPNATVNKWSTEVENGKTVYEAETVDGGTHRDMLVNADGTITETETRVTLAQLPAAVRTAATANNAQVELAELVVIGSDTTYEFKIRGRRGELKLMPNGHSVPDGRH